MNYFDVYFVQMQCNANEFWCDVNELVRIDARTKQKKKL